MKKLLVLVVGLILAMSLSACGEKTNVQENVTPPPKSEQVTPPENEQATSPEDEAPPVVPTDAPKSTPTKSPENFQTKAPVQKSEFIGENRAKELALKRAGISADGVIFDRVELDKDEGVWEYDVEFKKGLVEYDVEIRAIDGAILKFEKDIDD